MLNKCGSPTYKEVTGDKTTGYYGERSRERGYAESVDMDSHRTTYDKKSPNTFGYYSETSQIIETWYYNCGSRHFNWVLTFIGSSLNHIETTSYGSGDSDCIGVEARKRRDAQKKKERLELELREEQDRIESQQRLLEEAYSHGEEINTGNILLRGSPSGARVFLDDEHLAYIPCTLSEIEDGPHYLVVEKPGYKNYEEVINVIAGETLKILIRLEEE